MARRSTQAEAQRLILDSAAVIALSRGDQRARSFLARAVELDAEIYVPVAVLAETVRGGPRDATVQRVLKAVGSTEPTTEAIGRLAGKLLAKADRSDTIDAMIVAEAVDRGGARVLTSDPDDLRNLAQGLSDVVVETLAPPRRPQK